MDNHIPPGSTGLHIGEWVTLYKMVPVGMHDLDHGTADGGIKEV